MPYLFTSESVSEGHPDKVADQISDAIIDNFMAFDLDSKVACETLVTTGQVVVAGEVKSKTYLDIQKIVREVISDIGYNNSEYMFEANSCGILSAIHDQSADINQGVDRAKKEEQGAGDQGMMFGYACRETDNFMPLGIEMAHLILKTLADIRKEGKKMRYLRPDSKAQVTILYNDDHQPLMIDSIVISTQHDEFEMPEGKGTTAKLKAEKAMQERIEQDIKKHLIPKVKKSLPLRVRPLFNNPIKYHINPTGKFVIGGPHGDTGLTGRKIIVDTYGGRGAHGGGAFSGKDPSKVDRSAAYATRHIAKNMVAADICDEVLVQVSYAIGIAEPMGLYINTYGTSKVDMPDGEIAKIISDIFDMRPYAIEQRLKLRTPIYRETAAYGHMGRQPEVKTVNFSSPNGDDVKIKVETFTWEKLDFEDKLRKAFKI